MDACKVYVLQPDVECECVCEDSKTRVYVSLVLSADERKRRREEARRIRRRQRIIKAVKAVAFEALLLLVSAAIGFAIYALLAQKMYEVRGYEAIGGEALFAIMIGVGAWHIMKYFTEKE